MEYKNRTTSPFYEYHPLGILILAIFPPASLWTVLRKRQRGKYQEEELEKMFQSHTSLEQNSLLTYLFILTRIPSQGSLPGGKNLQNSLISITGLCPKPTAFGLLKLQRQNLYHETIHSVNVNGYFSVWWDEGMESGRISLISGSIIVQGVIWQERYEYNSVVQCN